MIQTQTILQVTDNPGAKTAKCIKILNKRKYAYIGDMILVTIRSVRGQTIKKGQIYKALVTRTKKPNGPHVSYGYQFAFGSNDIVLIDNQGNLIGSRIFGPITRDLRAKGHRKIISLRQSELLL